MQWWGPDAGPTLSVVADVRPGGRFSVVFRLLNGERAQPDRHLSGGGSREEARLHLGPARARRNRESLVTFRLEPFDGGTELTLTHEHLPDEEARTSHEQGWNGLLDKLPVFLGDYE